MSITSPSQSNAMSVSNATRCDAPIIGVGAQWVVDASGCRSESLQNLETIDSICRRVIATMSLNIIGVPQSHVFGPPHGVTALYLLSESHLAVHTYPEHGVATFNLVCCREVADWDWQRHLSDQLGASHVHVRRLARGAWPDRDAGDAT